VFNSFCDKKITFFSFYSPFFLFSIPIWYSFLFIPLPFYWLYGGAKLILSQWNLPRDSKQLISVIQMPANAKCFTRKTVNFFIIFCFYFSIFYAENPVKCYGPAQFCGKNLQAYEKHKLFCIFRKFLTFVLFVKKYRRTNHKVVRMSDK
jgi:hypothetical protein